VPSSGWITQSTLLAALAGAGLLLCGIVVLAAYIWISASAPQSATTTAPLAPVTATQPSSALEVEQLASTGALLPRSLLDGLKNATVFVRVEAGNLQGSGSGFVIRVDGSTGYIVTNHHVISPPVNEVPVAGFRRFTLRSARSRSAAVRLVFRSGTAQEQSARATVILKDAERDLAVLKVTGVSTLPAPIALVRNPQLVETMQVFLLGFPFGDALTLDKRNPAITVGKGTISSIRLNARNEVARIQIDGDLNPGNSGGPVVDAQGRLVGIAVAKVRNSNIGLAIPPDQLIALLEEAVRR
jgi:S1-C subfamily serine protease